MTEEVDFTQYLGPRLGSGCSKTVYVDLRNPDRIIAVVGHKLTEENSELRRWRDAGVRTAEEWTLEHSHPFTPGSRYNQYYYSMPRYPYASRSDTGRFPGNPVRLILSAIRMARKMHDSGLKQDDEQFLIDKEGRFYLHDPMGTEEGRYVYWRGTFNQLRNSLPTATWDRFRKKFGTEGLLEWFERMVAMDQEREKPCARYYDAPQLSL